LESAQRELREQLAALQRENSERERAEAAQTRLTAILEATPDIVGSADPDGLLFYMNRAGRETLGVKSDAELKKKQFLDFHPDWAAEKIRTEAMPAAIENGSWSGETAIINGIGQEINVSQVLIAHRDSGGQLLYFSTIVRDMTERRRADEALRDSQQRLLETSRLAGMAEVATGVLHNVGNVLNSVNVSAGLVAEKLRRSKAPNVGKAAALLAERNGDLANYLTNDENGRKLPGYLTSLGTFLVAENNELLSEVEQLTRNIEHIKEVVAMQQSYAKVSGVLEDLPVERLVEDAIAMNIGAFERHGVVVQKRFSEVPPVRVDRHKVLQILINLIRNAKYALDEVQRIDKRITIFISPGEKNLVRVVVADNGVGIPADNLDRIFSHGFTTRANGHGFGLHSGALAAQSLGGSLSAASLGVNRGATFTLQLPIAPPHQILKNENEEGHRASN
jgi:PAS domain S-box-containing protein